MNRTLILLKRFAGWPVELVCMYKSWLACGELHSAREFDRAHAEVSWPRAAESKAVEPHLAAILILTTRNTAIGQKMAVF